MAAIKSCTDIPQSKVLAEILPHESADMYYFDDNGKEPKFKVRNGITYYYDSEDFLCCWSLAALLGVIKNCGLIDLRFLSSTFDGRGEHLMNVWCCTFDNINTVSFDFYADTPIDVCYKTILKLHESNLLQL